MFFNTEDLYSDEIFLDLVKTDSGDPERDIVPYYIFDICLTESGTSVGCCDFRAGYVFYGGNIGYRVYEPYRGSHYAAKACKLLFKLARKHKMYDLIITCNPDNYASRKTCEYVGGVLEEIVDLPEDNEMYLEGERQKCIYRISLPKTEG
ncbi:MAG: GNAT family N-acetyltransferase [Oscillospiraceae bacterium]|nr:GNAT family N-acetyltransferase [Oscillospiraceae bacterium]